MSEFSRETLLNIIETDHVQCGEASALARIALAAMDSEPVAWRYFKATPSDGGYWILRDYKPNCSGVEPLYRHAQQPVVPDESYQQLRELYHAQEKRLFKIAQRIKGPAFDKYSHSPSQAIDVLEVAIFGDDESCRAAMLQELKKSAGTEAICRSNENVQAVEVQSLTSINPAPDLVSLQKKAESIIGNYPGIPDCWCRTCRPVVLNDMRFVVCPDCGNKRCPRANDHRNACTGSNEPGQEGSAYPDTPREVK